MFRTSEPIIYQSWQEDKIKFVIMEKVTADYSIRRMAMNIKSVFGFSSRDKPKDTVGSGVSFMFGRTTSGKPVNERSAMQTTAVYSCVRILAEAVASLPLHVYAYKEGGGK